MARDGPPGTCVPVEAVNSDGAYRRHPRVADSRLGQLPRCLRDDAGFPEFYGRNLDALIDCLTYRDEDDGMASITVQSGDVLTLQFGDASAFALRCPDQYAGLVQAAAFVNWRRIESGSRPIIALSFH